MAKKEGKKKNGCLIALIVLLVIVLIVAVALFILYKVNEDEIKEAINAPSTSIALGDTAPDFEVTTTDRKTVKLSELLEDKDALAVVLFATWCGPCEEEFPEMDKVYQKYQDRLGMIALDIDVLDDAKSAKEYADSHGLSFPIAYARDVVGDFSSSAYPSTVIIDRNGKVGFCRVGSIPDGEIFEKIVNTFVGDDYQERQLGYYSFYAYDSKEYIPGVEISVTSESGTQTYTTNEEGLVHVFTDKAEDLKVKIISVPDGYKIDGDSEISSGLISTYIKLPVVKA